MTARTYEFSTDTKLRIGRRSAFLCAICRATTFGPRAEKQNSYTNVGCAAHIAAASKGGARYDTLPENSPERSRVSNGIWLCRIHGEVIDADVITWTAKKLHEIKKEHESFVTASIGIPQNTQAARNIEDYVSPDQITPREYAFLPISSLNVQYKAFLAPILDVSELSEGDELGVLLCGSPPEDMHSSESETPWTVFVKTKWLKWCLDAAAQNFEISSDVPPEQILGVVPCWPDSFFEFLSAIVQTGATFSWHQHEHGYLQLSLS